MLSQSSYPGFLELYENGILQERVKAARQHLGRCILCPHVCRANRLDDEAGFCGVGRDALVSSHGPHHGEEKVLRGASGSGTVFFSGCNMRCVFCQNYEISQFRWGSATPARELAEIFLDIQRQGCHNLNLVTPSHVVSQILEALLLAIPAGFHLPIVYNTSGYDAMPSLRLLNGVIDIYMPDLKYSDSETARRYSGIPHYWEVARNALREMHRQVGDLEIENGLAKRGLLIRHLVLPSDLAGSRAALDFIASELSPDSWINIMSQYHPADKAVLMPELSRRIRSNELQEVVEYAHSIGLYRGIPLEMAS